MNAIVDSGNRRSESKKGKTPTSRLVIHQPGSQLLNNLTCSAEGRPSDWTAHVITEQTNHHKQQTMNIRHVSDGHPLKHVGQGRRTLKSDLIL
jgi:hypothetical protein